MQGYKKQCGLCCHMASFRGRPLVCMVMERLEGGKGIILPSLCCTSPPYVRLHHCPEHQRGFPLQSPPPTHTTSCDSILAQSTHLSLALFHVNPIHPPLRSSGHHSIHLSWVSSYPLSGRPFCYCPFYMSRTGQVYLPHTASGLHQQQAKGVCDDNENIS